MSKLAQSAIPADLEAQRAAWMRALPVPPLAAPTDVVTFGVEAGASESALFDALSDVLGTDSAARVACRLERAELEAFAARLKERFGGGRATISFEPNAELAAYSDCILIDWTDVASDSENDPHEVVRVTTRRSLSQ